MIFRRLLVILVDWHICCKSSSPDFGGVQLRLSFPLLCLIFPLAMSYLWLTLMLTYFMFWLCFPLFGLRFLRSRCLWLWALAVNSVDGLILFRMLGAYVDSSLGTLVPVVFVHLSPLDISVGMCNFVLHCDISGKVTPLTKHHCSADDLSCLIGIVARFCTRHPPWFEWGERHSSGPVKHLRVWWERIWVHHLGIIESVVVRTQVQFAVLLLHHLGLCCCSHWWTLSVPALPIPRLGRWTRFVWFLMAGYCVISSHSLCTLLMPEPLSLTKSFWMPWNVQCESCHIFAAYVHIVLVFHEDTTNLDIVKSWYCARMQPPLSVTSSTSTMSVSILISLFCILHCSMRWRSGDG